jgi:uncharacterized membrane protein YoaK (UPF0700 family)
MSVTPSASGRILGYRSASKARRWRPALSVLTPRDGSSRLALALSLLTLVSGLVDAACYLGLGRVFTANMTGNVVLLAFGAAGALAGALLLRVDVVLPVLAAALLIALAAMQLRFAR